jgi:hypothetical protein
VRASSDPTNTEIRGKAPARGDGAASVARIVKCAFESSARADVEIADGGDALIDDCSFDGLSPHCFVSHRLGHGEVRRCRLRAVRSAIVVGVGSTARIEACDVSVRASIIVPASDASTVSPGASMNASASSSAVAEVDFARSTHRASGKAVRRCGVAVVALAGSTATFANNTFRYELHPGCYVPAEAPAGGRRASEAAFDAATAAASADASASAGAHSLHGVATVAEVADAVQRLNARVRGAAAHRARGGANAGATASAVALAGAGRGESARQMLDAAAFLESRAEACLGLALVVVEARARCVFERCSFAELAPALVAADIGSPPPAPATTPAAPENLGAPAPWRSERDMRTLPVELRAFVVAHRGDQSRWDANTFVGADHGVVILGDADYASASGILIAPSEQLRAAVAAVAAATPGGGAGTPPFAIDVPAPSLHFESHIRALRVITAMRSYFDGRPATAEASDSSAVAMSLSQAAPRAAKRSDGISVTATNEGTADAYDAAAMPAAACLAAQLRALDDALQELADRALRDKAASVVATWTGAMVRGARATGLLVAAATRPTIAVALRRCTIERCGVGVVSGPDASPSLTESSVQRNVNGGVFVAQGSAPFLTACSLAQNRGFNLCVDALGGGVAQGCSLDDGGGSAAADQAVVVLAPRAAMRFSDNTFNRTRSTRGAVAVLGDCTAATLDGNRFVGCACALSFSVAHASAGVRANRFAHCAVGVRVGAGATPFLDANAFERCELGVGLEPGAAGRVAHNVFTSNVAAVQARGADVTTEVMRNSFVSNRVCVAAVGTRALRVEENSFEDSEECSVVLDGICDGTRVVSNEFKRGRAVAVSIHISPAALEASALAPELSGSQSLAPSQSQSLPPLFTPTAAPPPPPPPALPPLIAHCLFFGVRASAVSLRGAGRALIEQCAFEKLDVGVHCMSELAAPSAGAGIECAHCTFSDCVVGWLSENHSQVRRVSRCYFERCGVFPAAGAVIAAIGGAADGAGGATTTTAASASLAQSSASAICVRGRAGGNFADCELRACSTGVLFCGPCSGSATRLLVRDCGVGLAFRELGCAPAVSHCALASVRADVETTDSAIPTVTGCVFASRACGIMAHRSGAGAFHGCLFRGNAVGVLTGDGAHPTVTGSLITGADNGVVFARGCASGCRVESNAMSECAVAVRGRAGSQGVIARSFIEACGHAAVLEHGAACTMSQCAARKCARGGVVLVGGGGALVTSSQFADCGVCGLLVTRALPVPLTLSPTLLAGPAHQTAVALLALAPSAGGAQTAAAAAAAAATRPSVAPGSAGSADLGAGGVPVAPHRFIENDVSLCKQLCDLHSGLPVVVRGNHLHHGEAGVIVRAEASAILENNLVYETAREACNLAAPSASIIASNQFFHVGDCLALVGGAGRVEKDNAIYNRQTWKAGPPPTGAPMSAADAFASAAALAPAATQAASAAAAAGAAQPAPSRVELSLSLPLLAASAASTATAASPGPPKDCTAALSTSSAAWYGSLPCFSRAGVANDVPPLETPIDRCFVPRVQHAIVRRGAAPEFTLPAARAAAIAAAKASEALRESAARQSLLALADQPSSAPSPNGSARRAAGSGAGSSARRASKPRAPKPAGAARRGSSSVKASST